MSGSKSVQYTRCSIPQVSRFGRGEWKIFGGPIEKANGFLFFPRVAPPDSTPLDTNDAVPYVLKTLWPLRLMATDQINCIHTDNNVMYVLLSYLCYHSKLCC